MSRIYKRGGTWYADFEYKGKRHRKSLATRSKQVADLALKDIDVKIARERFDFSPPEKMRFDTFAQKFLEWYMVQNSEKSYQDYRNLFGSTIMPHFGQIKLPDITVEMIEGYKVKRSSLVSASTVNKELVALRHIFNKAILWGYLSQNPAKEVDKLRVKQRKFRFLTLEEIQKFIDACPFRAKAIFMTAIHAGLRKSELFRLEWQDVDFERHCIVISNKEDSHTKNYQIREIPMTSTLEDTLKAVRITTGQQGNIFLKRDGTPHGGEVRKTLTRIIKQTGLRRFTLHDLRHTFASHLVMDGIDLPTVQKLMGHSNINTTMIYAHLAPDHLRGAINRLDLRLSKEKL
jgi:integrase